MRALTIQVQPGRSSGMEIDRICATFTDLAALVDLVQHHQFDSGQDNGPYLNFTFGTNEAAALWRVIWSRLYEEAALGPRMRAASMAMCSSEEGWANYLLLYHFDPAVTVDSAASL
jgi:hypothetical protein